VRGGDHLRARLCNGFNSLPMAQFQTVADYLRQVMVLRCMPAAHPDLEIPSTLDSYFDHHVPLSDLACHLLRGLDYRQIFCEQRPSKYIQFVGVFKQKGDPSTNDFQTC
jgi:hypothetical protein